MTEQKFHQFANGFQSPVSERLRSPIATFIMFLMLGIAGGVCEAYTPPETEIGAPEESVFINAEAAVRWEYKDANVIHLSGWCTIRNGAYRIQAEEAILWLTGETDPVTGENALDIYATGTSVYKDGLLQEEFPARLYVRLNSRKGFVFHLGYLPQVEEFPRVPIFRRAHSARFPDDPPPWPDPTEWDLLFGPQDIEFEAQSYIFDREGDMLRIILHGDVRIGMPDMSIFSDYAVLWVKEPNEEEQEAPDPMEGLQSFYAEGKVVLISENQNLRADSFYLDTFTNEGVASESILRISDEETGIPVIFGSEDLYMLDMYTLLSREGYFTTCEFAHPHYRIDGRDIRITRGSPRFRWSPITSPEVVATVPVTDEPGYIAESTIVGSRHNIIRIGNFGIFYWPYISRDVQRGGLLLKSISLGGSSEFGTTLKTAWDLYDLGIYHNEWSDFTLNLDYYARRGLGIGVDFEYELPERFGFATAYFIRDGADEDRLLGTPVPQENRGRFLWRHREFLPDEWRADFELSYISDRAFMPVYYRREHEEEKAQETLAYFRKLDDNRAYTLLASTTLNDFETYVSRQPELGLYWLGEPIWHDRLVWSSRTHFSNLHLQFDEDLGLTDPDRTVRFHTDHEVSYPLSWGALQLDPFVDSQFTAFSNQAAGGGSDARFAAGYGIRAGTNFFRTFLTENKLLDINGIRHIFSPTLSYRHLFYVSDDPGNYIQYDDHIDGLDELHEVQLRLRNIFQTRRGEPGEMRSVDFLTADLEFNVFPGDQGRNLARDDYIELNAEWKATEEITITSRRNRYNISQSRLDLLNAGIKLDYWRPVVLSYTHDYVFVEGERDKSIGTFKFSYRPEFSRWRIDYESKYNFNGEASPTSDKDPKWLGQEIFFSRDMHQWRLILGAEFHKGIRDDTEFSIQLQPLMFNTRLLEL